MNYVFIQASSYILGYMRKVILALDFPKIPSNHGLIIFFPFYQFLLRLFSDIGHHNADLSSLIVMLPSKPDSYMIIIIFS